MRCYQIVARIHNVGQQSVITVGYGTHRLLRARKTIGIEVFKHVLNRLLLVPIRLLVLLLVLLFFFLLWIWIFKLSIPNPFNFIHFFLAEAEPTLHLRSLFDAFASLCVFLGAALLVIKSFLSNVSKLESYLYNLTKIHTRSSLS